MTTIVLTNKEWKQLRPRINGEHGEGIFFISWRLKERLGFTVRTHTFYNEFNARCSDTRLDFNDEASATFFRLKYL